MLTNNEQIQLILPLSQLVISQYTDVQASCFSFLDPKISKMEKLPYVTMQDYHKTACKKTEVKDFQILLSSKRHKKKELTTDQLRWLVWPTCLHLIRLIRI